MAVAVRHWYSNVGGSIVKMGDSDIHMPLKTSDKKHKASGFFRTPIFRKVGKESWNQRYPKSDQIRHLPEMQFK